MNDHQRLARAERAKRLLENELWLEAWVAYRERLLGIMETAKDDAEVLAARRLLLAATEARRHLERIIADGAVAAVDIEIATGKRPGWLRVLGH